MDDRDAFFKWLDEPMSGSSYNAKSRLKFAESTGAKIADLEWAFCSGRFSMRQEQQKEEK